jgi:hypothetical protein
VVPIKLIFYIFHLIRAIQIDSVLIFNDLTAACCFFFQLLLYILQSLPTRKLINTNRNTERIFPSVNFRGILPTKIFPRYILRELPWEQKLKQKKNDDVSFLPTELPTEFLSSVIPSINLLVKMWTLFIMSITKGITDGIVRRYFPESSKTVHFSITILIVVLYGQNHRRIEKSSVLFGGFLKKFN